MADGLNQIGFNKLLAMLDAERENAGAKYESLRARLIRFFDWRNCEDAEELADAVFDRVIRKIAEGEEIQNVNAYAATVAQFIFKEYCRRHNHRHESLDDHPHVQNAAAEQKNDDETDESEILRRNCFEKCFSQTDAETRKLLIAYHDTDELTMIATRKKLSEAMNINVNTLRIRVCRMKSKLENCVNECCEKTS